jgi:hypothetical protein
VKIYTNSKKIPKTKNNNTGPDISGCFMNFSSHFLQVKIAKLLYLIISRSIPKSMQNYIRRSYLLKEVDLDLDY